MWAKISSVIKPRVANEDPEPSSDPMSKISEHHPNLSVSHNSVERRTHNPPPHLPRGGERSMFKRLSKAPFKDDNSPQGSAIAQQRKLRSPTSFSNENNSQVSLSTADHKRPSPTRRSSLDDFRPPGIQESGQSATISSVIPLRRPSLDILRLSQGSANDESPLTPSSDPKFGSVRSILRDSKAPGTGQNVRFFSRDAYKSLSPNQSVEACTDDQSINQHEIFNAPVANEAQFKSTHLLSPIPAPEFDNSLGISEKNIPNIPPGLGIETQQEPTPEGSIKASIHSDLDRPMTSTPFLNKKTKAKDVPMDVFPDASLSAIDENIFHLQEEPHRLPPALHNYEDRNRTSSDGVFQPILQSSSKPSLEVDINDELSRNLAIYSASPEQPDPFRANATTYYTPQTMIPVTPPQGVPNHARKISKEDGLIFSLQTQLALQTELCSQYETDLRARDELVDILSEKLKDFEANNVKSSDSLKYWKKRVAGLEKEIRYLQHELDDSQNSSRERSFLDEASGVALHVLQMQIRTLTNEKAEWVRREECLKEEVATLEGLVEERRKDMLQMKETLRKRDENQKEFEDGIREAERTADLETERDALKQEVEELERKIHDLGNGWEEMETKKTELENEVQEVWNYKQEMEREREQLQQQLQQEQIQSDTLAHKLRKQDDRITELEQIHQLSEESISRLEEKLQERDLETKRDRQRAAERESEAGQLREEIGRLRCEHDRTVAEQNRALEEATLRQDEMRVEMENLIRAGIEMKSLEDEIHASKEENERQWRRIQMLQQDSADKDLKILNYQKQHQRDKEDAEGLNLALDAKQQELELMKRNLGVKGTGGTTPAPASRITTRRDSLMFNTPIISRPPSVSSDASSVSKERKRPGSGHTTISSANKGPVLGRSSRVNASTTSATKRVEGFMGPPPSKGRSSLATPTPISRISSLSRSSSLKPAVAQSGSRRVPSLEVAQGQVKSKDRQVVTKSPIASVSEQSDDNKENRDALPRSNISEPA